MKLKLTCLLLFVLIGDSVIAQDSAYNKKWYWSQDDFYPQPRNLNFGVRGQYIIPVKSEKLASAKLISDVIPGYPKNWISDYASVEIKVVSKQKELKASGKNDVLTKEQMNILKSADLGSEVQIVVKDKFINPVTDNLQDRKMNISMTIIPEVEAEFVGGEEKLSKYLRENIINIISEKTSLPYQQGKVQFTVNEKGEVVNSKVSMTSGDKGTDKFLIDAINKMPKWKPAENSMGVKVKQDFEFSFGTGGC